MAEQGRYSAIKIGHQFAFINSGIGAKLKEGDVPAGVTDPDQRRNYREEFNRFLDETIGESEETPAEYTYSWKDNQQRNHSVKVKTTIDEVDTFKLKTTILPWEGELALLYLGTAVVIAFLYSAGAALLRASCICMSCCNNPWTAAVCCPCWYGLCAVGMALLQAGIIANELAIYQLLAAWAALLIAWAGIAPGPTITDDSGNVLWATIAWIEDIDHNRRVRVDTWQEHQGADLGVWQTNYPEVHSYSVVDFRGRGEIRPPQLRHDSSVVTTDIIRAE